MQTAATVAASAQADEDINIREDIEFQYQKLKLKADMHGFHHEFFIKSNAYVKELADGKKNGLPPLEFAKAFQLTNAVGAVCVVPLKELAAAKEARDLANQLISDSGAETGGDILEVLRTHHDTLKKVDRSWLVELTYTEVLVAGGGSQLICEKAKELLPTAKSPTSFKEVETQFAMLTKSPLYDLVDEKQKGMVRTWHEAVADTLAGCMRAEVFKAAKGFKKTLLDSLIHCCSVEHQEMEMTLYGQEALDMRFQKIMERGAEVACEEVEVCNQFKHYLNTERAKKLREVAVAKLAGGASASVAKTASEAASASKSSASAPKKSKRSGSKTEVEISNEIVMGFFNSR